MTDLIPRITQFVVECMKAHDPSHNPAHIHRVVSLALSILKAEQSLPNARKYDPEIVHLAALLHDIGDRKYLPQVLASTSASASGSSKDKPVEATQLVKTALLSHGASATLASRVQAIVSAVSYTSECKDPLLARRLIDEEGYPELAIVQDADRLDAIGAVGIGRCFTFLGAKGKGMAEASGGGWEMQNSIEHFEEKLERLEGMMKTETGKKMARRRTERLVEFRGWWEEEMREAAGDWSSSFSS
ncbi:hypothetical protein P175DRAFT_0499974 [Aspergillus ochraceoroseus IBT 24754]|uniref:HD/PDEase domain-containing protein n=3 Tax=Aspergillus subgen. Nidulantes TaxID=2720870 RepID=A0A0F8VBG1_9EURO|nr:uncharacterized protein P175DRAFT_0499974 [Aspergillus ochraceoroseus IBT 24754]KKK17838.1 hypothetical protein AOCH_004031 [Aspergillus ochraceoroseus]KKK20411.1 hypothetical protein ARAM_004594 [Aspergillus rambellii]PTU23427.1 hypothetical protein P175DRAFT_0499974 [Aspergillus ochraceoroseus IBT 24754]